MVGWSSFRQCRQVLRRFALLALALEAFSTASAADFEGETLVFGGDAAYPPFEWDDGGTPRGFDIDLARALTSAGGAHATFRLGDWPKTIRALESGEVDVAPMFLSEERQERFRFTPPFHFVSHQIYARTDSANIHSVHQLAARKVAVEELSFAHHEMGKEAPDATLVLTSNTVEALDAVVDGQANFAVLAAPTAQFLIDDRGLPLHSVGSPLWPRGYAFAVRKDRSELADWLTHQFHSVVQSGAFHEIFERWEERLTSVQESASSRALKIALVPVGLTALLGLAWALRLRTTLVAYTMRLTDETSRRNAAELEADWRNNHDVYTELPRLHHFSNQVATLLAEGPSNSSKLMVALKPADLDRIIRTLGHETGLAAMRDFVRQLRSMEFEAYGQTGREVFLVFGARRRIEERLRAALSPGDTLVIQATSLPRLHAGAAVYPEHGRTVGELVRRAETALGIATARRETWCEYRPSMEPDRQALQLISAFRERAGAGLYPVFQPKIDIRSGALVGAEALARWDAPGIGSVPPSRFVPLLEDAGLIRHLTGRMLQHAVRVAADLRQGGTPCPISVNASVSDLLTDKVRKEIFKALKTYGGMAGDLRLELTESCVAEHPETVRWIITRLLDSGIATAIDDFGTGYSSLSYLSDFPIKEVKIDRTFVANMGDRRQSRSIIRSTIAMAHELGLLVVAEGLETSAELEMLRQDNCDQAQGYLFSKPLVEAEFIDFVKRHYAKAQSSHALGG